MGRTLPHGADESVIQIIRRNVRKLLGRHVDGDDDFVFALARKGLQHFISFHHD